MRSIDIVCVNGHVLGDDAMWWGGFWNVDEIYIASVADMVEKVEARLDEEAGTVIRELRLLGHGTEAGQRIGGYLATQFYRVPGPEGRSMRCYGGKAKAGPPTFKDEVKQVLKHMPWRSGFGM